MDWLGVWGDLRDELTNRRRWASQMYSNVWSMRDIGMTFIEITLTDDAPVARVRERVDAAIAGLVNRRLSPDELQMAVTAVRNNIYRQAESLEGRAALMQYQAQHLNNPADFEANLTRFSTATAAGVRRLPNAGYKHPGSKFL